MKKLWINKQNAPELLLFFNGWGMDEKPFKHLAVDNELDVLMIYDYKVLEDIEELNDYKTIHLVAWSLGVFAASKVLSGMKFASATAINGTLKPIDEGEGIAPVIFQGTIDSWSDIARMKFNRRMCGIEHNKQFKANAPERSVESQKSELIALQEQITNSPVPENIFQQAIISLNDKIFTRHNQETHWKNARIPLTIIDESHYFFPELKSWKEILFR
jgi:pimeloyl-[acyl-carrier protein] methyl ester esterase